MIAALLVAYNEEATIADAIRSVKAYVDRFVVIDSVFVGYPATGTHSSDRTREVALAAAAPRPITYVQSDRKLTETEARNLALAMLAPGEWGLVIDGDEILYGDLTAARALFASLDARGREKDAIHVRVYSTLVLHEGSAPDVDRAAYANVPVVATWGWQPRLVRMREGLEYRLNGNGITPGTFDADGGFAGDDDRSTWDADVTLLVVNRHVAQDFDGYQRDYVWESGQG